MSTLTLAPNDTWFTQGNNKIKRNTIEKIQIVTDYTPLGVVSYQWDASMDKDNSIIVYVEGNKLTLSKNGSNKIKANINSDYIFSDSNGKDFFNYVVSIDGLQELDTSAATTFKKVFDNCSALASLDVTGWNTSNVTNMTATFSRCFSLKTIIGIGNWDVSKVTTMQSMFQISYNIEYLDLSNWRPISVQNMVGFFMGNTKYNNGVNKITTIGDTSNWNLNNVTNALGMFLMCGKLTNIKSKNWGLSSCANMDRMFASCSSLISVDAADWNTTNVTNMSRAFKDCSSLETIDVSKWNVSNVTRMDEMFAHCNSLKVLDVSNWKTNSLTKTTNMFIIDSQGGKRSALQKLNVSNWDTSKITDMSFMFYGLGVDKKMYLDVSRWDVSKVENFDHMFANSHLCGIDPSNWVTTSAKNMGAMFHSVREMPVLNVSKFVTRNVISFGQMFESCFETKKIIGLENFDTTNGLSFYEMFRHCEKLEELDLSSFNTRKAKDGVTVSSNGGTSATCGSMFDYCNSLKKVTFGKDFSYNGDGTTTEPGHHAVLPVPSPQFINGADGNWYDLSGKSYTNIDAPKNVPETYYASKNIVSDLRNSLILVNYGTMYDIGLSIRKKKGDKLYRKPKEMANAIMEIGNTNVVQ